MVAQNWARGLPNVAHLRLGKGTSAGFPNLGYIYPRAGFFLSVFGSLELKIGSLESEKIIIGSLESKKIGSLESEKSVPTESYRVPNIFLKKNPALGVHLPI